MTTKHEGKSIREVWDWRLSRGMPILYNSGDTWIVKITANDGSGVLEEYDTGILTKDKNGKTDNHDAKAIAACYDWLRSVRDKYSRDHIELRKPVVALINHANDEIHGMVNAGKQAEAMKKVTDFNSQIKEATSRMKEEMVKAGGAS